MAQSSSEPLADAPLSEDAVLGTHEYEDVLFTPDAQTPVDVRTGEAPPRADVTVADAREFAAEAGADRPVPYVAKHQPVAAQIETHSPPYTACAAFHFSITGGIDQHRTFNAAFKSDAYETSVDTDYRTGTLTLTVERAESHPAHQEGR